jgi:hypothetical protein
MLDHERGPARLLMEINDMGLPVISTTCMSCGTQFSAEPTRTFLGFQRITCPKCTKDVLFPLTSGYRITYWVILIIMVLSAIGYLSKGEIPIPGLLGVAVIIGLIKDMRIRKRVAGPGVH